MAHHYPDPDHSKIVYVSQSSTAGHVMGQATVSLSLPFSSSNYERYKTSRSKFFSTLVSVQKHGTDVFLLGEGAEE